jgi:2',3'-cyclic-nucleotide 2'-phosphodiesterase (5'-nucleotidase family)
MQTFSVFKRIKYRIGTILAILVFIVLFLPGCRSLSITKVETTNIRLDSTLAIVPDARMEAVILPYRERLRKDMGEVLCTSKVPLFGGRPESLLTNFCADLLLDEADSICLKRYPTIHVDVAMVNRGGLRVPIPKGEVKVQDMFELMPFENEVVFLNISGSDLRKFIDHMASRGGEGVAGVRFGIKDNKGLNPEIEGKLLDDSKKYWLATSDYIANGGDGSGILQVIPDRIATGVKFRDMFIDHLRKLGRKGIAIDIKTDGRVYDAK